jgi:hypothetical protein
VLYEIKGRGFGGAVEANTSTLTMKFHHTVYSKIIPLQNNG